MRFPLRLPRAPALWAGLSLLPATLPAQGEIRLGVGGGILMPLRSYADLVDRGWVGTASLTFFPAASASLGFRIDGLYGQTSLSVADGKQSQLGGTANLVFQVGARQSPNRFYVFGGGGYFRTRTTGPGFGGITATNPALGAGVGFSFGARALGFFAEARYLNVYNDGNKPQYAPLTAGISLGGL
jgi:hypothetical protein